MVHYQPPPLMHWGRVTHICISKLNHHGSGNGLSPDRRQTIIWTNDGLLLNGPLGKITVEFELRSIYFHPKHRVWIFRLGKSRPFCLSLNVLISPISYVYMRCDRQHNCDVTDALQNRNIGTQQECLHGDTHDCSEPGHRQAAVYFLN